MDENEIYREARRKFLEEKEKREQAAAAQRQAAYIESLDSAKDMREYTKGSRRSGIVYSSRRHLSMRWLCPII